MPKEEAKTDQNLKKTKKDAPQIKRSRESRTSALKTFSHKAADEQKLPEQEKANAS